MRPFLRLALLLLASALLLLNLEAAGKRLLTAQDLWSFKRVSPPVLSKDGKLAVFSVQTWSLEKNKSTSHLWLSDLASGELRQLTFVESSDGSAVFSPDGTRIAFVSKRGEDQSGALYILSLKGGDPERVVEMPLGVSSPQWLPDGKGLVFATKFLPEISGKVEASDLAALRKELRRRKEAKMTAKATENRAFRTFDQWAVDGVAGKLIRIDLETRKLSDLTPGFDRPFTLDGEGSFTLSPNGRQVAVVINSVLPPYNEEPNNDIYLVPTDGSGSLRNVTADNPRSDGHPVFSKDGRFLYFSRLVLDVLSGENTKIFRADLSSDAKPLQLAPGLDYSFSDWVDAGDGASLYVIAEERGYVPLFRLDIASGKLTKIHGQGTVSGLAAEGETVLVLRDDSTHPAELFQCQVASGELKPLTHFNDALLSEIEFGKYESHTFKGAAGDEVHLWLTYPPNFDPAKRYPLVQLLHGGPQTMCRDSWSYRWNTQLLATPGYIVTWVNRHGSTGFGEKYARSINAAWGDKPFEDIMKATDYLLAKIPAIDPARIGVAGASYGGYLGTWILGHTDRFKCIVNHAGVSDFDQQTGCDMVYWFERSLGGKQWAKNPEWDYNNPIRYAANFKTPMLVIHGETDYRVPYGQALSLYSVLKSKGIPARLVVYPNENHWVLSPQNAVYWNYEVQSWLSRYLGGTPMAKPVFAAKAED